MGSRDAEPAAEGETGPADSQEGNGASEPGKPAKLKEFAPRPSGNAALDLLQTPVLLRLPRAVLVVILGLLLLALIVAFVAGRAQGHKNGFAAGVDYYRHQQNNAQALKSILPAPRSEQGGSGPLTAANTVSKGQVWGVTAGEIRQSGMNYCLLGYWREAEARDVAEYFAGRGVDVAVVPFKNGGLFHVAVISAAIPSGDPDFQANKRDAEVEIRRVLGAYLKETGGSRDMRNMLQWERFGTRISN